LYLHGYTDSTQQFDLLGTRLFERGHNVYAPRQDHHGHRDRMCDVHARLNGPELVEWTTNAVDNAEGLGAQLTVIGLSLGGVLATWVAQHRAVDQVIILSPAYGASFIPAGLTPALAHLAMRLPNFFLWWDRRLGADCTNEYSYPRFSTHALAQVFILADGLLKTARQAPPAAHEIWMITNANDFEVNNHLSAAFVAAWRSHGHRVQTFEFPRALGLPHDLLDPTSEGARPDEVNRAIIDIVKS
jgi:carboxylesterase